MQPVQYHVNYNGKRTTIKIDYLINDLLTIALDEAIRTEDSKIAIRQFIQDSIDNNKHMSDTVNLSRYAMHMVVTKITKEELVNDFYQEINNLHQ